MKRVLMPVEPVTDGTEIIRSTFQYLVHKVVERSTLFAILYSALFFYFERPEWTMCLAAAVANIVPWIMTRRKQAYPVFLAGLFLITCAIGGFLYLMSMRFGRVAGFQYLILAIVPLLMFSGRVSMPGKWLGGIFLLGAVLWIDQVAPLSSPLNEAATGVIRGFNFAVFFFFLAALSQQYFTSISLTQHRLSEMASIDSLTGLLNRRRWLEVAGRELTQSQRYRRPLSIILADLDHFKSVNDLFGHAAGDLTLQHVSHVIQETARETDTVARWGGEEFILLLPNSEAQGALNIAQRIGQRVAEAPLHLDNRVLKITLTLGVADVCVGETLQDAIARADAALYAGKAAGRNRATIVLRQGSPLDSTLGGL